MDAGARRSNTTSKQPECPIADYYDCRTDHFTSHCQNCPDMHRLIEHYCKMFPNYEPPGFIHQPEPEVKPIEKQLSPSVRRQGS